VAGPFVLRRALQSIVLLLCATAAVFLLVRIIPADPAQAMLGETATPAAVATLREALGLDRPLHVQYLTYLRRLVEGDLGTSIRASRPVLDIIAERASATIRLTLAATVLSVGIGVPVGILAAVKRGSLVSATAFALSLFGQAVPGYWLGLILMNLFAVRLAWLPVSGSGSPAHLVLPAVTLAAFMLGLIVRMTRSAMLEVMTSDFIRTARGKGIAELGVVVRHGLSVALIPIITVIGLQVSTLFGGAVVTEAIFGWPGIGSLAVLAISQRDYPVVEALVLISVLTFLIVNFLVDILYAYFDPRVTYQ
jgi:peptide/nickel transport system permease protein